MPGGLSTGEIASAKRSALPLPVIFLQGECMLIFPQLFAGSLSFVTFGRLERFCIITIPGAFLG